MNKKKLIALGIIAFLILLPFRTAFINFTIESEFIQVLSMTLVVLGACAAIMIYNAGSEEESSHQ